MTFLSIPIIPAIGWALLHFLWQGLLIGLMAAAVLNLLRNARPQVRYGVALVALIACVIAPAIGIYNSLGDTTASLPLHSATAAALQPAGNIFGIGFALAGWQSTLSQQLSWVVVAWALGACALGLRFALGFAWVNRLRSEANPVDASWQLRLDGLAAALGLRGNIRLLLVDRLDGPVAAGWWRPVVLVPAALITRMPADFLEALLAHELAHIRRHDYLVNLMQGAIETLLFYHPVVWWLSRQVRTERELVADDLALRAIPDPRRLALALQQLDRLQAEQDGLSIPTLASAAHGGNLMNRITRLIRPNPTQASWKSALPLLLVIPLCAAVVAQATTRTDPSYALVRGGEEEMMVSGDMKDLADVKQTRQLLKGDFLWFREGGTAYVVQDPALLARANEAWAPARALGNKMERLGDQMHPHAERMEALGKQMEKVEKVSQPVTDEMERIGKQMEPLAQRQQELGDQMRTLAEGMRDDADETRRQSLSAQMQDLQEKMRPLNEQMSALGALMSEHGRKIESAHRPLQELGEQMRIASEPMKALGEKMRVLGEQQEKLSREADAQTRQLLEQALRDGKAQPSQSFMAD